LDSEKEQSMPNLFDTPLPLRPVQERAINWSLKSGCTRVAHRH
jgi:hypothetical protein